MLDFRIKMRTYEMDDRQANQTKPGRYLQKFSKCSQIPWSVIFEKKKLILLFKFYYPKHFGKYFENMLWVFV